MIEIKNIHKHYGKKVILKDISLKLPTAKSLGIIGRNGSGKTTLINIMTNIENQDKGSITYDFNNKEFP